MYDHTIDRIPKTDIENVSFFKSKITLSKKFSPRTDPNETLSGKRNVLLKFDIEGSEYELTDMISDENLDNVLFIVCEVHFLSKNMEKAYRFLKYLEKTFVLFHLHGNSYSENYVKIGEKNVPNVCELTLINRKLVKTCTASKERFPIAGIDWSCNSSKTDMVLDWTQNSAQPNCETIEPGEQF